MTQPQQDNSTTKDIAAMVVASLVKANVVPSEIGYNVISGETLGLFIKLNDTITLSVQWKRSNYAEPDADVPTFECAAWEGKRFRFINPYKNDKRTVGCDSVMAYADLDTVTNWAKRLIGGDHVTFGQTPTGHT